MGKAPNGAVWMKMPHNYNNHKITIKLPITFLLCSYVLIIILRQWAKDRKWPRATLTFATFHILQVSLLTATLVYYFCYISRAAFAAEAAELLRTRNGHGRVDVSLLAAREQVRDRKKMNESG